MEDRDIKNIRKKYDLTQNELARMLGVDIRTVQNWEAGKNIPRTKYEKLRNLLDGEPTAATPVENGGIPLIPVDAMAGFFSGEQSAESYEYINYHVPAFRECDFLIMVKGDSMLPKYNNGDIVACKKLSLTDIFFQWGKVYVVNTSQGALIKRVEPGSKEETITLVSINEQYKPFEIRKEIIYDIALVCGLIKYE